MINSEHNGNGVGIGGAPAHDKQPPNTLKKTALRDVQNENVGSMHKHQESLLPGGGKANADAIKVCGTKRLTPERPSSSQSLPSLAHNGTNENVMNARRRFELELGRGRLQNNVEKYADFSQLKKSAQSQQETPQNPNQVRDTNFRHLPVLTSNSMTPIMAFSSTGPSVPTSFGKHNNGTQPAKIFQELPHAVDSKTGGDQLRAERYFRLQKFLRQGDDSNQREYIKTLLNLSPAELSKHAVELEKRSIQLTLEEGNEIKRMGLLNILPKPSASNNLLQPTQLQSNNHK